MKVLMYGWEFPPYISGGLGVACYNITKYLDPLVSHTYFVLPKSGKNESTFNKTTLLSSIQISKKNKNTPSSSEKNNPQNKHVKTLTLIPIKADIDPYNTQESFLSSQTLIHSVINSSVQQQENTSNTENTSNPFSIDINNPLMAKVLHYANHAGTLALMYEHDIIHAHDWLTILAAIEAKKYSQKPVVFHVHATEYDRSGKNMNQLIYNIEKLGIQKADKVIAVSHYTKKLLIEKYQADPDKIEVVHNGVSKKLTSNVLYQPFEKKINETLVLYLGRLTYQKGPDYFIKAAKKVLECKKDIRFVIAGNGDMMPWLMEEVNYWGLGEYFYFTGFLNDELVEHLFKISDMYVLPSVSEPFGIAPLEALYYGVPVILSKSSGVSEVLNHVLKVDFWDINEMANKILALAKYKPLKKHLMHQSKKELPNINWDVASKKIFKIYQQLTRCL